MLLIASPEMMWFMLFLLLLLLGVCRYLFQLSPAARQSLSLLCCFSVCCLCMGASSVAQSGKWNLACQVGRGELNSHLSKCCEADKCCYQDLLLRIENVNSSMYVRFSRCHISIINFGGWPPPSLLRGGVLISKSCALSADVCGRSTAGVGLSLSLWRLYCVVTSSDIQDIWPQPGTRRPLKMLARAFFLWAH